MELEGSEEPDAPDAGEARRSRPTRLGIMQKLSSNVDKLARSVNPTLVLVATLMGVFSLRVACNQLRLQTEAMEREALQAEQRTIEAKRQSHYQAWQTINSAAGLPGSGGRIQALEELRSG